MMRYAILGVVLLAGGAFWWLLRTPSPSAVQVPDIVPASAPDSRPSARSPASVPTGPDRVPTRPAKAAASVASAVSNSPRQLDRRAAKADAEKVLAKVAVTAPATKAAGAMSRDAVRFAIGKAKPAVAECYAQALEKTPELAGRLTLRFTIEVIDGDGRLRDADVVEDELNNPFLGMCALNAIAAVEFEGQADGVITVNYPFNLQPAPPKE